MRKSKQRTQIGKSASSSSKLQLSSVGFWSWISCLQAQHYVGQGADLTSQNQSLQLVLVHLLAQPALPSSFCEALSMEWVIPGEWWGVRVEWAWSSAWSSCACPSVIQSKCACAFSNVQAQVFLVEEERNSSRKSGALAHVTLAHVKGIQHCLLVTFTHDLLRF